MHALNSAANSVIIVTTHPKSKFSHVIFMPALLVPKKRLNTVKLQRVTVSVAGDGPSNANAGKLRDDQTIAI